MTVWVICDGCNKKAIPTWRTSFAQMQAMGGVNASEPAPPTGWLEWDGMILCGDCADRVRRAAKNALSTTKDEHA